MDSFIFHDIAHNQHENLKFRHHMLAASQLKPKAIKALWKHYLQAYRHLHSDNHNPQFTQFTAALAYELYLTQAKLHNHWQHQTLTPDQLLQWIIQVKQAADHNNTHHPVSQNLTDAETLARIRDMLLTKNIVDSNRSPPTDITTLLNGEIQHLFDIDYGAHSKVA